MASQTINEILSRCEQIAPQQAKEVMFELLISRASAFFSKSLAPRRVPFDDLTGKVSGRLIAAWPAGRKRRGDQKSVMWLCVCNCGELKLVAAPDLKRCRVRSCGCLGREQGKIAASRALAALMSRPNSTPRVVAHGHSGIPRFGIPPTPTYSTWIAMKARCYNRKDIGFKYYGGRGITVCDAWKNNFEVFLADMGLRPKGMTLDRFPDNDGNYEPGNCRWATPKQQSNNQRKDKKCRAIPQK